MEDTNTLDQTDNRPFLILDTNSATGETLRTLLSCKTPLRVTVSSGHDVNWKEPNCAYEAIFARGQRLHPPKASGYVYCGFIRFSSKKKNRILRRPEYVLYQVFCMPHSHHILQWVHSEVLRNYQGDDLVFDLDLLSLLVTATPYPDLPPPLTHPPLTHLPHLPPYQSPSGKDWVTSSPFGNQAPWGYDSQKGEGPQPLMSDCYVAPIGTNPPTIPLQSQAQEFIPPLANVQSSRRITNFPPEEEEPVLSSHSGKENQSIWFVQGPEGSSTINKAKASPLNTPSDDLKPRYFKAFMDQLAEDVRTGTDCMALQDVRPVYLDHVLEEFAWRLYQESPNTIQLETSIIIHQQKRNAVDIFEFNGQPGYSSPNPEIEDANQPLISSSFFLKVTLVEWIRRVDSEGTNGLSHVSEYRQYIQGSHAYKWLLIKIGQHNRLSCDESNIMHSIGTKIRSKLRALPTLRKMGRNRTPTLVEMDYFLDWDLFDYMQNSGISPPFASALPNMLCITGTWNQAQATTVTEYMEQTWPQSSSTIITLLQELLMVKTNFTVVNAAPAHSSSLKSAAASVEVVGDKSRYRITVVGGYTAVSEVGEQLAWLASALRSGPDDRTGFVSSFPCIDHLNVWDAIGGKAKLVRGECFLVVKQDPEPADNPNPGFCWERLFCSPNIVRGYPILRRSIPNSGLEISLRYAAMIMGSSEVVKWDERLLIKGFNMLMIATLVAADVMVWHLFVSGEPEQRISYVDPRLDEVSIKNSGEASLQHVEGKRHIIGWCSKATDLCGHATANHEIKPAGLPKAPASITIDKLYIEGGSPVTAGLMLDINKKEKPFWLQRGKDYPSLLNWVKMQPVVFYDVEDRRAWLVDGASALLHLVRISLHRDINEPESAYDWVYDASKLKDQWPGVGSRQAAVETLKSWDNRALDVYIIDKRIDASGMPITKYSTFEERVMNILHSIEILVDRQAKVASQDGIKIPQTWDPRRDVVGFDILDVIDPAVPIYPRIQHINSWGHGWIDLIPTIGITTIFGREFGDLIRADEPDEICPSWRSVPCGKDYLAASVSTMQMLHEKRLLRLEPGLVGGEITKKITWVAAKEASIQCSCLKGQGSTSQVVGVECNHIPVQFLAKRWWSRTVPHGLKPVQLGSLDAKAAVIFGHTVLGLRAGERSASKQVDNDGTESMTSGEESLQALASGSSASQSTSITVPSDASSSQQSRNAQQNPNDAVGNTVNDGKKNKRWSKFKNWVKR